MQLPVRQPALDFADGGLGAVEIGEVDLDVILRAHLPGAVLREWMARAGDYAPAGGREALHGGMADAAARSGEQERAARLVVVHHRHRGSQSVLRPASEQGQI